MTTPEVVKNMPNKQLIEVWESTTDMKDENISIIRGWLMDEMEERFPEAFEAWLDSDYPEDSEFKNFI